MFDTLLSYVAPHHCSGCDISGTLLCNNCKYDIISEPFLQCAACGKNIAGRNGLCEHCRVPYVRAWCVSARQDHLQRLIGNFKFTNAKSAYIPLAKLLDNYLPNLPSDTVIVPVPTANSHIRQRGYDHMRLVAKQLRKLRGLPISTSLQRATDTQQRSASARQRIENVKSAFYCNDMLNPKKNYLLIDDVITTGATVKYAAIALRNAGAETVWVASISRQPLD